jgi:hypothetical protein
MHTHSWPATLRLATAVSLLAAVIAVNLSGRVSEHLIMVAVIVGASAVGWLHAERPLPPDLLRVRKR